MPNKELLLKSSSQVGQGKIQMLRLEEMQEPGEHIQESVLTWYS